jgi:hypothetical protein
MRIDDHKLALAVEARLKALEDLEPHKSVDTRPFHPLEALGFFALVFISATAPRLFHSFLLQSTSKSAFNPSENDSRK